MEQKMNAAQQIRQALGIEAGTYTTHTQRNASSTKSGPGRRHVDAHKRGKAEKGGQPGDFAGTHTNPQANARRAVKESIGARQYRKQRKALALAAREQA
jgi:hypothetical protein